MLQNESDYLAAPLEFDPVVNRVHPKSMPTLAIQAVSLEERLRDPVQFIAEMCRYFQKHLDDLWKNNAPQNVLAQNWEKNVEFSHKYLQRQSKKYRGRFSHEDMGKSLRGQSAEFLLSNGLRAMIDLQNMQDVAHVPQWHEEDLIYMGERYFLRAFPPTNALLVEVQERDIDFQGEVDSLVLVDDDVCHQFDVTMSFREMEKKRDKESIPASDFLRFRASMKELLEKSDGKRGYEISKTHVHFQSWGKNTQSILLKDKHGPAVLDARITVNDVVGEMSELCRFDLEKSGAITWKENDEIYVLNEGISPS